jgi:branched-chain amino acid transport system permease protein
MKRVAVPVWLVEAAAGVALLSCGLLAAGIWGWTTNEARQGQIITFFTSAIIVLALQLFSGNSGLLSFGHLAFVGVGAYVAGILMLDPATKETLTGLPGFMQSFSLGFFPATLVAAAVVGLLALVIGLPVVRLTGAAAVIATLVLLLIANVVFGNWTGVTRGAGGLYGVPLVTTVGWALAWTVVALVVARLFKASGWGLQLQASREDELAAPSVGVRVRALRLRAWVLSAMLCGVAGSLIAGFLTTFSPTNFFLQQTFIVIVMLIVGGMGTVTGPLIGAALVTLVQEGLRGYEDESLDLGFVHFARLTGLTQIALVVMILAILYFRRDGLVGRHEADESLRLLAGGRRLRAAPGEPEAEPEIRRADAAVSDQVARD